MSQQVNYNNVVVLNILAVQDQGSSSATLSTQLQQPETENESDEIHGSGRRAAKAMKLGKAFLPLTVQAALSVFCSEFEAKQVLHVVAVSNTVGYIGCLADILLRHHGKPKAAKILGSIGATAAVFGFLTIMGSLIELKLVPSIGFAGLIALVFLIAVTKL